jgi:RHS repeat-associated protein
MTDSNGVTVSTNRVFPFGELWDLGNPSPIDQKFTTFDRESVSGLDYAMARFYAGRDGRFMSPDKWGGDIGDPQSLNRYTYTQSDPINFIDPSGKCYQDAQGYLYPEYEGENCDTTITVDVTDDGLRGLSEQWWRFLMNHPENIRQSGNNANDQLDAKGLYVVTALANRVDATNQMLIAFPLITTAAGAGAGAYPYAATAVNEWALGASTGRLMWQGTGVFAAGGFGTGRLLASARLAKWYGNMGQPFGDFGWKVLSRFWSSGATGAVNVFAPSLLDKSNSMFWTTELPILLQNPNVTRIMFRN